MPVIPSRFLFRYSIPVRRVEDRSSAGEPFLDLAGVAPFPDFGPLDDCPSFARLRVGWNDDGIGFRVEVTGKKMPVGVSEPGEPGEADGLQIWLDTRNTQTIHRATRFCHHFAFLPSPGKGRAPGVTCHQLVLALAKEDAPLKRAGLLRASCRIQPGGYLLEAWIPAECLHGYEPESNPLLGFYYLVRDAELGEQFLGVGREFPFDHDPSLWSTLELAR